MTSKSPTGKIITFYSYKGGTGRSMALANIACLLGQSEKDNNVLMIDWDLEAPGLHRYFQNRIVTDTFSSFENQVGLIDLFIELRLYCEDNKLDGDDIPDNIFERINIEKNLLQTNIHSLHLMTAGKLDKNYSSRVANFDWNDFFTKYPSLIFKLAEHLAKKFDYVLVDSRTGHTDISGICTTLMPDKLVVVFTPNTQSLSGVLEITKNAIEYRKQSDDLRQLVVFPLVSRVEPAEPKLRKDWRFGDGNNKIIGYQPQFEELFTNIYNLPNCNLTSYFDDIQIQYVPRYAYGEEIAVLSERSEDRLSLARSYESFAQRLIDQIRPWDNIIETKSSVIEDLQTTTGKIEISETPQTFKRKAGRIEKTIFICYRRTNFYTALAVYQDLTAHGYDVFIDYQSIPSGDFEQTIRENILARAHFIAILSPSSLEKINEPNDWFRREIEIAIDSKRNIIPLMLEGFDFSNPLISKKLNGKIGKLKLYNGIRAYADYFFESMEKLRQRHLNVLIGDISLSPLNAISQKLIENQNTVFSKFAPVNVNQLISQEWLEKSNANNTETKNYEDIEIAYRKAIDLNPLDVSTYFNLGTLLTDLMRYDEAEAAYRKAIELNPSDDKAYSNLGNLLSNLKRYAEAEAAYRKAIELNPADDKAYSNLGNLLSNLKRYDEAEAAYRKAIELNPSDEAAYSNIGNMLNKLERYDEAEAAYRKAIELNTAEATAYSNLGNTLNDLRRYSEAEAFYRKAIELNSTDDKAYSNLGNLLSNLNRYDEAEAAYRKAIELNPSFDIAYANLGQLFFDQGNLEGAILILTEAIQHNPQSARCYRQRALIYQTIGNDGAALDDYRQAITLLPDYGIARMSLFGLLMKIGKTKEASEHEAMAREFAKNESEYNRACFESLCNNTDEALNLLKIAFEKGESKEWAKQDPDLKNIRNDPRFKELVGE